MKKILVAVALMWSAVVTVYAIQMQADVKSGKAPEVINLSSGTSCSSSSSSSSE